MIGQALLLCAGMGTRLAPLTDALPKCLMPINGRPLLDLWLEQLAGAGVAEIFVNTHHHAGLVADHVRAGPFAQRVALFHEDQLLGTAGTLARHAGRFRGPFLFAHADNLSVFDLAAFAARHRARAEGIILTMMTFETDRPHACGIVELDAEGRVSAFHEKVAAPPGRLANGAVFVAEPEVAALAARIGPPPTEFSTAVLPQLIGRIQTFHNAVYHRDIGTPESLARAQFEHPLALAEAETSANSGLWHRAALRRAFADALAKAYPMGGSV